MRVEFLIIHKFDENTVTDSAGGFISINSIGRDLLSMPSGSADIIFPG